MHYCSVKLQKLHLLIMEGIDYNKQDTANMVDWTGLDIW